MEHNNIPSRAYMLTTFAEALAQQGYQVAQGPLSDTLPVNSLVVSLDHEEPLQLVAYFLGDLMNAIQQVSGILEPDANLEPQKDFLQLFIRIPVGINQQSIPDLARLILMINWSTPVGAFGLNETQEMVFYRHVFEWLDEDIPVDIFVEAVNGMSYFSSLRYDLLKKIASSQQKLSDLLAELDASGLRQEVFPGYDR